MNRTFVEEAHDLLMKHDGIQRNAEAEAWQHQEGYRRDSDGYKYWAMVAIAIVEGQELPPVPRKNVVATPAFKPALVL